MAKPREALTLNMLPRSVRAAVAAPMSASSVVNRPFKQEAELIAAEAIGPPVAADRGAQSGPDPAQEGVAGGVAEGVVVALEAVEIEEHERLGVALVGVGDGDVQIAHQPPAVAQAAEAVGHRVLARCDAASGCSP